MYAYLVVFRKYTYVVRTTCTYSTTCIKGVFKKSPELYFRQLDVYETLAPTVFDYEDSKSESCNRDIFVQQIDPHTCFLIIKNHVYFGRQLKTYFYQNFKRLKNCS